MSNYICKICSNEFRRYGKRIPKFCSFECRNKSYEKIKFMKCKQCKKNFSGTTREMQGKKKFCSQNCVNAWKKNAYIGRKYVKDATVGCNYCGEKITRIPGKINKKNYCDKRCRGKAVWKEKSLSDLMMFKSCFTMTSKGLMKFKSKWEAAFAVDFLDKKGLKWEYEKTKFQLSNHLHLQYTPDFFIKDNESFVEIKGYDKSNSIEKFKNFRKENPEIPIIFANKKVLEKVYKLNLKNEYLNTFCTTGGSSLSTLSV